MACVLVDGLVFSFCMGNRRSLAFSMGSSKREILYGFLLFPVGSSTRYISII